MQMNYLLQTWYTPNLGIRSYTHDMQYVNSEYAPDTKVHQCEETSVLDLDHCIEWDKNMICFN
jgi:hypothetical protein